MEIVINRLLDFWHVLGALALVVFIWRPELRLKMFLAALIVLPSLAVKPLISTNYWAVFERNGGILGFLLPRVVVAASVTALLLAVYEKFLGRKFSPNVHPSRRQLAFLGVGILAFGCFRFLFNFDFINSLILAFMVNAVLIVVYERLLLWDLLFSSIGMGLIYVLAYIQTSTGLPGDLQNLWFGENVIGVTILSSPAEELLAAFLFGSLWGPIYVALKDIWQGKAERDVFLVHHLRYKIVVGRIFLLTLGTVLVLWGNNFLLTPKVIEAKIQTDGGPRIRFDFNFPIFRPGLRVQTNPPLQGNLVFENSLLDNHMYKSAVFIPETNLIPGQNYTVTLSGIANVFGLGEETYNFEFAVERLDSYAGNLRDYQFSLSAAQAQEQDLTAAQQPQTSPNTSPAVAKQTVLLNIPVDYQDKPLSCEVAALKMVLNYRGLPVSEEQLMAIVGFDPTVKQGNVWGDPDVAFVGDINGKQNTTGYGVHWTPIARAANNFRRAESFSGWRVTDLTAAILEDRPVIIWGVIGNAYPETWYTPAGRQIHAWKGEHTFVVVGFNGDAKNPESFIINDPLAGRVTWSVEKLQSNWATFNNSGVVVY